MGGLKLSQRLHAALGFKKLHKASLPADAKQVLPPGILTEQH